MDKIMRKLMNVDRRILYVFIFLAVFLPFLFRMRLKIVANENVRNVYNTVQEVSARNGVVLMSFDFDPSSKAELEPIARAMLTQIFTNGGRVAVMGSWITGVGLAEQVTRGIAKQYNKTEGVDWVFLGWKPNISMLIINMGIDFRSAYTTDSNGNPVKDIPMLKHINKLKDFDYVFSLSAGSGGVDTWVTFGQSKYNIILGGACTGVMAPDYYPYLQARQLNGLIGGMTGAAQYETLVGIVDGSAVRGMDPQSIAHIVLIIFILLGNVCFFYDKYRTRRMKQGGAQ